MYRFFLYLFWGCTLGPAISFATTQSNERIIVPAYFYPAGSGLAPWKEMIDAAKSLPSDSVLAIANPFNGPGNHIDTNYSIILNEASKSGMLLLGYTYTKYGMRPQNEVLADIARWKKFYPQIRGIFFDEQATSVKYVSYYAELANLIRMQWPKILIVSNPGTLCDESYFTKTHIDIFIVFENHIGLENFHAPDWFHHYSKKRAGALTYGIPSEKLEFELRNIRKIGLGTFYISDRDQSNPWNHLPSYWEREWKSLLEEYAKLTRHPQ